MRQRGLAEESASASQKWQKSGQEGNRAAREAADCTPTLRHQASRLSTRTLGQASRSPSPASDRLPTASLGRVLSFPGAASEPEKPTHHLPPVSTRPSKPSGPLTGWDSVTALTEDLAWVRPDEVGLREPLCHPGAHGSGAGRRDIRPHQESRGHS